MNLNQSNLTFDDRERLAYMSGVTIPEWIIDADAEAETARQYMDIAEDQRGICSPDDLKGQLDTLNDLYCALPDGVSDADDLKAYVSDHEGIADERDLFHSALETLTEGVRLLTLKKGAVTKAQIQGLYEWLYFVTNERQDIDRYHFKRDLDIL